MSRFRSYLALARRTLAMARGTSYWHVDQPPGRFFVPGKLAGYFNDFSAKTLWDGPTDDAGIPVQPDSRGDLVYFPITVFQKALGHWERWLGSSQPDMPGPDHAQMAHFRALCAWGRDQQNDRGGWPVWFMRENPRFTTVYSAMAQGQGTSVLCRMYREDGDSAWLAAARRALDLMLMPIAEGGMAHCTQHGLILEEYPTQPLHTVLNGWIYALYGLYDFLLVEDDPRFRAALDDTLRALVAHLPEYDLSFWSRYTSNYAGGGLIASPFYHALHCVQLGALERTFPGHAVVFGAQRARFERQMASPVNRARAVAVKVWQKLVDPPDVIFR
jgi:hypothetical protein